jgi:hypothetical protein
MQLLPGDLCLVAEYYRFGLQNTSAMEVTTRFPPIAFNTWPWHPALTWQFSLPSGQVESFSQPYHCRNANTVRLVLNTYRSIHGVIIPCDSNTEPEFRVTKLMNFTYNPGARSRYLSLGYNSAILNGGISPVQMLYYSWPDGSRPSNHLIVKSRKKGLTEERCFQAFDEGSGRMVVESHNEILVYDFAKFKKCI